MESKDSGDFIKPLSNDIFKIPGEPAIVINDLPPLPSTDTNLVPCAIRDVGPQRLAGFGEWVEGREIRKLFGDQYFHGKVAQFDKEMGWYRVVYDDGDFEDLEWRELMEVLVPLDVSIPLKMLAMKIIKKRTKSLQTTSKSYKLRGRNINGSLEDGKGKEREGASGS